jgi:tripartite-type tricarboxylate transporter receptor subunit TctC
MNKPASTRRSIFRMVAAACCVFAAQAFAAYPDKPIRVVLGFPPGSVTDIATRIVAAKMSEGLGQQLVVDNKPGASTNIAGIQVARSAPDGYTIFVAGNTNAVNPFIQKNIPFDVVKDFEPIGLAVTVPSILVVHPSLGVTDVAGLTALVKRTPGKVFFASSGNGTVSHLAGELYSSSIGGKMVHVAYKGSSQAVVDLLGGQVGVMFAPASTVMNFVRDKQLQALAITSSTRSVLLPDLPTMAEAGIKNYDTRIWFGMVLPVGTPAPIVQTLYAALSKALDSPEVVRQLAQQGIEPFKGDGAAFTAYMTSEEARWAPVIRAAGITAE